MGTRGYHSYRGRGGRGRVLLAVVLALILLLALGFLFLQDFMVYDSQGNMTLDLPFLRDDEPDPEPQAPTEPEEDVNLIIEAPETPAELSLRAMEISLYDFRAAAPRPEAGFNGLVAEVKGEDGVLYYQSALAAEGAEDPQALSQEALTARLGEERDWTAVAALHCLHDTYYAFANMDGAGICQSSGYIWYDNTNTHWLDPSKEAARAYLCGLAAECADMGFDEILLRGLAYPTRGKQYKIDYSGMTVSKAEALETAMEALRETLGEETALSLELEEELILAGSEEVSGQDIARLVPLADRVYVETEDPDAVWAALAPYVPEGRERETFLVVTGEQVPESGSCCRR